MKINAISLYDNNWNTSQGNTSYSWSLNLIRKEMIFTLPMSMGISDKCDVDGKTLMLLLFVSKRVWEVNYTQIKRSLKIRHLWKHLKTFYQGGIRDFFLCVWLDWCQDGFKTHTIPQWLAGKVSKQWYKNVQILEFGIIIEKPFE